MSDSRVTNLEEMEDGLRLEAQSVEPFCALSLEETASSTQIMRSRGSKSKVKLCQAHLKLHSPRKTRSYVDSWALFGLVLAPKRLMFNFFPKITIFEPEI